MPSDESLNFNSRTPEVISDAPVAAEAISEPSPVLDLEKIAPTTQEIRKRIEERQESGGFETHQVPKLSFILSRLTEIEALDEGMEKDTALLDFRSEYWEFFVTDAEKARLMQVFDARLALRDGVEEPGPTEEIEADEKPQKAPELVISDALAAQEAWTEEELRSVTGGSISIPEGYWWVDEESKTNYKIEPLTTPEGEEVTEEAEIEEEEPTVPTYEEVEGILTEEGFLASAPEGEEVLPHAFTRVDGTLSSEDALQKAYDEFNASLDEKNYMDSVVKGIAYVILWIKDLLGSFGAGESSGQEGDEQEVSKPRSGEASEYEEGESLYTMNGESVELKYTSYDSINRQVSSPGDKVAAAALLGVAKNQKCQDPNDNHCSGWVETVAAKVDIERYKNSQNSYVNSSIPTYRAWNSRSRNQTSFLESGLRPGDMVIARSSGSPTGFHDQIVVDVASDGRVLVASQETKKRRALRWKRFTEDDIAVVSRPGWTGPSSSPGPLIG